MTEVRHHPRVVEPVAVDASSRQLIELARRVAATDCSVLISGQSGTGKEVLARFIHRQSPRAHAAFVAVNCAAIPESMLEGVLFGYERGAFTGAHAAHAGKFEQANGGSLLLDEISEMPLGLQAKLLRVLQEREVDRIGGRQPVPVDIRVIATTNRDLTEEVRAGHFREDLYFRLNVFPLQIQPLTDRRADILPIAAQILNHLCHNRVTPSLTAEAVNQLLTHPWPGNARELGNVLQRALILCDGGPIDAEHIDFDPVSSSRQCLATVPSKGSPDTLSPTTMLDGRSAFARQREHAERAILLAALREGRDPSAESDRPTRVEIARRLGISPRTLRYKLARMRAAGMEVPA
jgi:two-component system response regulator FlrC